MMYKRYSLVTDEPIMLSVEKDSLDGSFGTSPAVVIKFILGKSCIAQKYSPVEADKLLTLLKEHIEEELERLG